MAAVLHNRVDNHRNGGVQVGVVKHHLWAFAAQLQRHGAVPLGGELLHQRAHARAAGKADVVNAGVAHQCVSGLVAVTGNKVDAAGRKAHLGHELGHAQQRQARVLSRLDHAHIARGQRAAHAAAKNLHGVVPRHHVAGYAVGLAPGEHAVAVLVRNGLAVQFVAGAGIKLKVARQRHGVGARLLGGFAAVALLQRGQLVGALAHAPRQGHQQPPACGRVNGLPRPVKAGARSVHGRVNVWRVAARQRGKHLAV